MIGEGLVDSSRIQSETKSTVTTLKGDVKDVVIATTTKEDNTNGN